jgi:O-antigen ligase
VTSRLSTFVPAAYLFACLILGGSVQGVWQNMALQLSGVAVVAWAALNSVEEPLTPAARQLLYIGIFAVAVAAMQLIPLPASIWRSLGPREPIAASFLTLGMQVPAEPLSLTPAAGVDALLKFIPPLAMLCAMVRLNIYRPQWLAVALIAGTVAGIALGALQVASFRPETADQARWYVYADTNFGKGVGFFANADHMATLLIITIPFLAAITAIAKRGSMQRSSATVAVAAALAIVVLVGIALNGSLAGYGLALPVIAASALIVVPRRRPLRRWIVGATALLLIASVAALEVTPIGSRAIGEHAASSVQSRVEILSTTSRAIADFMPFGSGLGSFEKSYPLYERPEQVTSTFVVHAHNDYAELVLELGFAGVLLIVLFFAWWAVAVWRVWRTAEAGPFARAAAIASAAILVHSLVDFPLRTAAISTCFAMCLAFLVRQPLSPREEPTDLRPVRHVRI